MTIPAQKLNADETSSTPSESAGQRRTSDDAALVRELKARDDVTNWRYLAEVYLVIAGTIGLAIFINSGIEAFGAPWGWSVPVDIVAIAILGAAQHQLGGAVHEGTHFLLFKNRRLNEIASDWLAAFPLYTSTYQFRIHHLAHHQFVNDPERDPDIAQLKESGHWLDFPIPSIELLLAFLKQLSPWRLIRFTLIRAKYSAIGFDGHAYINPDDTSSKWPLRIGIIFAVVPVAIAAAELLQPGHGTASIALLAGGWLAAVIYLSLAHESDFTTTRLAPVISHRATMISRITYFALLYGTLTAVDLSGIAPAWHYYLLYWIAPLFTSFPLFMMLRQWIQHGNADRGRYTNTRVFLVGPVIRYAVFPWGMDYHLPHHVMASVPHYNLKRLHEVLLSDPEYRDKAVVIDGCISGRSGPSVVDSLGPAHAPKVPEQPYVDNASLEYVEVNDPHAISREAARSTNAD